MGIYSNGLFTTCDDLVINLNDFSKEKIESWQSIGFFTSNKEQYTLKDFMIQNTGCLKILGYLEDQKLLWNELFQYLERKFPERFPVFHFYCSDERKPYYISWNKKEKIVNVNVCEPQNMYCFKRKKRFFSCFKNNLENDYIFDEKLYKQNWMKIHYTYCYKIKI